MQSASRAARSLVAQLKRLSPHSPANRVHDLPSLRNYFTRTKSIGVVLVSRTPAPVSLVPRRTITRSLQLSASRPVLAPVSFASLATSTASDGASPAPAPLAAPAKLDYSDAVPSSTLRDSLALRQLLYEFRSHGHAYARTDPLAPTLAALTRQRALQQQQ